MLNNCKSIGALILIISGLLALAGCSSTDNKTNRLKTTHVTSLKKSKDRAVKMELLFVINPAKGEIDQTGNKTILTLTPQPAASVWFSDRPVRHAGKLNIESLILSWDKFFAKDNPNAALVIDNQQANTQTVTLSKPELNSDKSISLEITPLDNRKVNTLSHLYIGRHAVKVHQTDFKHASLFIDDVAITFDLDKVNNSIKDYDATIQALTGKTELSQADLIKAQQAMQDRQLLIEEFSQILKQDHDIAEQTLRNAK